MFVLTAETRSADTPAKDGKQRAQHSNTLDFMHSTNSREINPSGHTLDEDQGSTLLCRESGILLIDAVAGVLFREGEISNSPWSRLYCFQPQDCLEVTPLPCSSIAQTGKLGSINRPHGAHFLVKPGD